MTNVERLRGGGAAKTRSRLQMRHFSVHGVFAPHRLARSPQDEDPIRLSVRCVARRDVRVTSVWREDDRRCVGVGWVEAEAPERAWQPRQRPIASAGEHVDAVFVCYVDALT